MLEKSLYVFESGNHMKFEIQDDFNKYESAGPELWEADAR
jgi:hypothetical protein